MELLDYLEVIMEYFYIHNDKIFALISLIMVSISMRVVLQFFGQQWITTIAHTSTLVFLPIITYSITSVISGNIALSLGMVGALSIVRFRNPVRSPLELSIYFAAITMGIAASVNLTWMFFLVLAISLAGILLYLIDIFCKFAFKSPFFKASFSEGNSMSTLEAISEGAVKELEDHIRLVSKRRSNSKVQYRLASQNFQELNELESNLITKQKIITTDLKK